MRVMQQTASAGAQNAAAAGLAPWFHNLHMPDGTQTAPEHPLGDFPARKWRQLSPHLPADLTGWRALDIGCNAGFYAFELARRGADVLAIDAEPHFLRQAEWAARELGLDEQVRLERRQVYDVARMSERFDLVLFMGVFYHLRYPQLALDAVAAKTGRLLVFQTLTLPGTRILGDTGDRDYLQRDDLHDRGWPKMAFIEHSFAGDASNWWIPNHAACEALLRAAGMRVLRRPGHEIYICEPSPAAGARTELRAVLPEAAADV